LLRLGKTQALETALAKNSGMHFLPILQAKFEVANLKVTCKWPRVITALVITVQVTTVQVTTAQVTTAQVTAAQVTIALEIGAKVTS
jgi:hypothetical protein